MVSAARHLPFPSASAHSHPDPRLRARRSRTGAGFTLIEVMITVAIVAILAAVALPSYTSYVLRGQLPEALTNLSDYRVKMEQYYQDNRNYGTGGAGDACADGASAPAWNTFAPAGAKYFTYACTLGADNQSYVLTATGTGSRTTGYDYRFASATGAKTTTQFNGSAVTKTCWATQAGDC